MALILLSMTALTLTLVILLLQTLIASKLLSTEDELASLESGFEAMKPGLSFSSPFFVLASLFVLFDLEIVLLFPGVLSQMSASYLWEWSVVLATVLLTLVLEWAWYGLKWHV